MEQAEIKTPILTNNYHIFAISGTWLSPIVPSEYLSIDCSILNDFFLNVPVATGSNTATYTCYDARSLGIVETFSLKATSDHEVLNILCNIRTKCEGADRIGVDALKLYTPYVLP
ncbi:hypothetical protein QE152_g35683 [Popillia japonica]|uniref:Uncharacterized protein n=1 Tax=Popillia japonica TaxID=7064 RepID=A0AAW1IF77_POPJA